MTVGYLNRNNGRVRNCESKIRKGAKAPEKRLRNKKIDVLNRGTYAQAFMRDYIFKHSQCSPSTTVLYVDLPGQDHLYKKYCRELKGKRCLSFSHIQRLWNRVLCQGVTHPETAVTYNVEVRKSHAKGFDKCARCEYCKMRIAGTDNQKTKAAYRRKLRNHLDMIADDRDELARIQRLCMRSATHTGFYIDAADSAKFQIPTTSSTSKILCKLWRVRQKLTCVQLFDVQKTLYIFRTLPDVPTGANLTATILGRMLASLKHTPWTEDLHINVDGAGDNINYTIVYSLMHMMLCAEIKGWALRRIHLYRMKVGHTHCDIDATFGVLSRNVYGKRSRGDARRDILSFKGFQNICGEVYGARLVSFEDVRRVRDFDRFVKKYRPKGADVGIQKHFSMCLELRKVDGKAKVFAR